MGRQPYPLSSVEDFLFSSWKGRLLLAVGGGFLSSFLSFSFLFFPGIGLILSNFCLLPIFLSGFTLGVWGALISSITLCLISSIFGNPIVTLITMSVVIVVIRQSLLVRELKGKFFFYPGDRLIVFLLMMGLLFMVVLVMSVKIFFLKNLSILAHVNLMSFEDALSFYIQEGIKSFYLPEQIKPKIILFLVNYGVVFILISWILTLFINAMIALRLLKNTRYGLRPPFTIQNMSLPLWYPFLFGGFVVLIFMGGDFSYLGKNGSLLVIMGFVFQGCSLIHVVLSKWFEKQVMLQRVIFCIFYGSMIVVLPWFLGIAGLGILDHFMNLKERVLR